MTSKTYLSRTIFSRKELKIFFDIIAEILEGDTMKKVDLEPSIKNQKDYEETLDKFLGDPRVKHALKLRKKRQERVYALGLR